MSRESGIDLVVLANENAPMPNIVVHIARMIHTPIGMRDGLATVSSSAGIYSR